MFVVVLLAGILLWAMRFYFLSLAGAVLIVGLVLLIATKLLGEKASARIFVDALLAYFIAMVTAAIAAFTAYQLANAGGPDLVPGMDSLVADNNRSIPEPEFRTLAFPLFTGLLAGTWCLNRKVNLQRLSLPLRWVGLGILLTVAPIGGAWLTRSVFAMF